MKTFISRFAAFATLLCLLFITTIQQANAQGSQPVITSFSPATGPVGTLVTITGSSLGSLTGFMIGGVTAIVVSNNGTTLVGMVMPGAATGAVSVTTAGGSTTASGTFMVTPTPFPTTQQGSKIIGSGGVGSGFQGWANALSADGKTAIVGGYLDNMAKGATWAFTRVGNSWIQQGDKLVGSGATGPGNRGANQGESVALSADGNTAIIGGPEDNNLKGAIWVFTRNGGEWTQQGEKLIGVGLADEYLHGYAVALSADGNTAVAGNKAAVWIFTRNNGVWSQQGPSLVGWVNAVSDFQGYSVAISADGNTIVEGDPSYNNYRGSAWVFVRNNGVWTQQSQLLLSGIIGFSEMGGKVALSADGNTAIVGGRQDNGGEGAAWVFVRTNGIWNVQAKLFGLGAVGKANQGSSVAVSADGNIALIGGQSDNGGIGATWVFTRSGSTWTQRGTKLVGVGSIGPSAQGAGTSVSLSSDATTALVGGFQDDNYKGASWAFTAGGTGSISLTSAAGSNAQQICITSPLTNITYNTTGASGAIFTGLPAGVSGVWSNNTAIIYGTPATPGVFNYTVTLSGATGSANGTITVKANNTIALTSAAATTSQSVISNSPITKITYATTGAAGATVSGLPPGVSGLWASNVVTISGTPSSTGVFNYIVSLGGGCGTTAASGTITVTSRPSQITDYYRSIKSGNWNDPGTWESSSVADFSSGVSSPATLTPDFNSNIINIRNGHTVNVTAPVTIDGTFVNAGGTLSVNSTLSVQQTGLTIQSNAAGTGSIGSSSGSIIGGLVTVERYIKPLTVGGAPRRAYRLLTSPIKGTNINLSWQEGQTYNGVNHIKTISLPPEIVQPPVGYGTMITGDGMLSAGNANYSGYDFWPEIANSSSSIRRYDIQDPRRWIYLNGGSRINHFNDYQAYLLFIRGDRRVSVPDNSPATTTLRATGNPTIGPVIITSTDEYLLIGNPYASAIDFDKVYNGSVNIAKRFTVWDPTLGKVGGYKTVVATGGGNYQDYPTDFNTPITDNTPLRYIQSGQGFFVEPATPGYYTLNFTESCKVSQNNNLLFRQGNGNSEQLRINLMLPDAAPVLADGVAALYDNRYSPEVTDENDVKKINNFNENLAIERRGNYLLLEAKPLVDGRDTIYLSLYNTTERAYQLQLKADNMIGSGLNAFLLDAYTGTETYVDLLGDITTYDFSITSDAASKAYNRFKVVYRPLTVLPVTITQLKATQVSNGIQLDWTAQTELGISKYEVEKSVNGSAFNKVASVNARGNSGQTTNYGWLDGNPVNGPNYYRIKVMDKNGEAKHTNIVRIQLHAGTATVAVYPNPIKGNRITLELNNVEKGVYDITLYNNLGQQVYSGKINHSGGAATQTIQLANVLPQGMYQISITNKQNQFTQTIIAE